MKLRTWKYTFFKFISMYQYTKIAFHHWSSDSNRDPVSFVQNARATSLGHMTSDAIWKKHFCFFRKKLFFMTKKTWPPKKTLKKCFFCFFHNKLCIKEKTKVVLLIWGPGDPVCPREVKITPPTPSCSPLCGSVCGNWPNWGLLCKLVAKTFFFLCL